MKVYKRYAEALKAAKGQPILRVQTGRGSLHIVGIAALTEISIINTADGGCLSGYISAHHLDRLGNGNHATAVRPINSYAFNGTF